MLSEDTLLGLKLPASEESPPANAAPAIALPFRLISVPRIPFFRHFHLQHMLPVLRQKLSL